VKSIEAVLDKVNAGPSGIADSIDPLAERQRRVRHEHADCDSHFNGSGDRHLRDSAKLLPKQWLERGDESHLCTLGTHVEAAAPNNSHPKCRLNTTPG
jgi:hypothetical protein